MVEIKEQVYNFWNQNSCGEILLLDSEDSNGYLNQMAKRYALEPYIEAFAGFRFAHDLDVLEIGVGLGADHQRFAESGARMTGIDLTERAIEHTRRRLELFCLHSDLRVGDAEELPFVNESFDIVYSWGVLHHSPNTSQAVSEVWRVLRSGGLAKVMVYHTHSLVGYMLWVRYALLTGRPWRSLAYIYANYLESPGTKAYTENEARMLFGQFRRVRISTVLTHGDLLDSGAGQRHQSFLLSIARMFWPRKLLRLLLPKAGLFMLIEAMK